MSSYPLQGRTVFITGGANGIGAATAREAAKRGARVAIVDIATDAAERLAASLPDAIALDGDVRDMDSLNAAVEKTVDAFGGIDVAMANAGVGPFGTAETLAMEDIERVVDINFTGVFRTLKATIPAVADRRGYILITASLAAILHVPPLSHYTATKAGVEAFGNSVRIELAERGVDVGVAYFGVIDTDLAQSGLTNPVLKEFRDAHTRSQRGPFGKIYPAEGAGKAVARGMERRARRVMYPGFIRVPMLLRAAMPRVVEAIVLREGAGEVVRGLDEAARKAETGSPELAEAALQEQLKAR